MVRGSAEASRRVDRRTVLASLAAGSLAATAGCVRRVRSIVNRDTSDRLSVTITTVVADFDRGALQIARELRENLEAVGIEASLEFLPDDEFLRDVLVNHSFDIFVGRHPGGRDPDFLYEALHSVYADESGWQNPFGFTSMAFDEKLETQRRLEGEARREQVADVLRSVVEEQPFVPVCSPLEHRLVRDDRFDGWSEGHLASGPGYLGLEPLVDDAESAGLRGVITDARPTENLNPLAVEYRNRGTYVDLLYDAVGRFVGPGGDDASDEIRPWLASSWSWSSVPDGSEVRIDLRPDCHFHDGEPVTADDVAFTYRFLADTSLGDGDAAAPSPRYRGHADVVESVDVRDELSLTISFDARRGVAERALTVPVLPEHVWRDRTDGANLPGVTVAQGTTDAIVTDNVPAVGSGPFQFADREARDRLAFERFDDHFTLRADVDLPEPTVREFVTTVASRSTGAIELVEDGDVDVTVSPLEAYTIEEVPGFDGGDGGDNGIGAGDDRADTTATDPVDLDPTDGITLLESPSQTFYHVGFNVRNAPFSNPYFRRIVAGLLDKAWLAETVFEGYADPIATPAPPEWTPPDLAWNGEDPAVPFFGSRGELDGDVARDEFRNAGFRYDDEGYLLARH